MGDFPSGLGDFALGLGDFALGAKAFAVNNVLATIRSFSKASAASATSVSSVLEKSVLVRKIACCQQPSVSVRHSLPKDTLTRYQPTASALLEMSRLCRAVLCGAIALGTLTVHPSQALLADDLRESATQRMGEDLKFLSSDALEGRNVGSDGIKQAGEMISKRFDELGFKTDLFDGTPYQEFTIPGPVGMGPDEQNTLSITGKKVPESLPKLVLGETFTPLTLGNSGTFEAGLVFAGYGISAEELDYDDLSGVDVTGKVVIVLRKEPQQNDASSRFDGNRNSPYAYFSAKEANVAMKGAAAMILINDSQTVENAGDDILLPPEGAGAAMTEHQIPTYYCRRSVIDPLVQAATGKTIAQLEAAIDETGQPASCAIDGVTISGETSIKGMEIPVRNVIGLLPGTGNLADEFVIIGAHYDHVGMGGEGSLAPGTIAIHNGADDNGSGTTTMLEVARRLAAMPAENRRSLVFMAFTAEEKGLLGSRHYVRNPRFPLEQTVAMLNMDMVGRLNDNTLTVYGIGTAEGFDDLIDRMNERTEFRLDKQAAGLGPSDHSSFYEVNIPVFHFFTGLHNEYHRPSDDFELIDLEGMARVAEMVTGAAQEISVQAERPKLLKTEGYADVGRNSVRRNAPPRAVLGVQLDTTTEAVTISGLNTDSPAAKAGLQAGDVIVKLDDTAITSIEDLRNTMTGKSPGNKVMVTLQRGGETIEVEIELGRE